MSRFLLRAQSLLDLVNSRFSSTLSLPSPSHHLVSSRLINMAPISTRTDQSPDNSFKLRPAVAETHRYQHATICIEGNIGCGKTTLLEFFRGRFLTNGQLDRSVIAEPVERWRNVDGENLFHYLYKDPARYSLAFQTYVQLTMIKLHSRRPKMMERSIYSARYCFVENLYHLNYLSKLEYAILDKWFKHLVLDGNEPCDSSNKDLEYKLLSQPTGIQVNLIIYLRCSPQRVMDRIRIRSRAEEKDISFDYIKSLHDLHEDWLIEGKYPVPAPVLVLDTDCKLSSLEKLYEKAFPYINGEKKISKTPLIISLNDDERISI